MSGILVKAKTLRNCICRYRVEVMRERAGRGLLSSFCRARLSEMAWSYHRAALFGAVIRAAQKK